VAAAQECLRQVLDVIATPRAAARSVLLPPSLVVRPSTASTGVVLRR
jgi:DNA-binding LacI/PurR family transcriptional regulator